MVDVNRILKEQLDASAKERENLRERVMDEFFIL